MSVTRSYFTQASGDSFTYHCVCLALVGRFAQSFHGKSATLGQVFLTFSLFMRVCVAFLDGLRSKA